MGNCEECNFYTEQYDFDIKDNIPFCVKLNCKIDDSEKECGHSNNNITCYDCSERNLHYYEMDDVAHYCRKLNCLIYSQQRSVLYKGDFMNEQTTKCENWR